MIGSNMATRGVLISISISLMVMLVCFSPILLRFDVLQREFDSQSVDRPSAVTGRIFTGNVTRPSLLWKYESSIDNNAAKAQHNSRSFAQCKRPLVGVTTTLQSYAECVREVASIMPVLVVGDHGGSPYISAPNITFLSVEQQDALYPQLSSLLPKRSFSRKNVGIAHALLAMGACAIWDFDDDNCLGDHTAAFLQKTLLSANGTIPSADACLTSKDIAVNPYLLYGSPEYIWPRGFPLSLLGNKELPQMVKGDNCNVAIDVVQVMQDVDPDVDAIWRLQYGKSSLPFRWQMSPGLRNMCLGIDPARWVPFNAQSTLLSSRAAAIAYLPWTVHGRVSDIWRSYVMQYLLGYFERQGGVAFGGASVRHFRTKHNYMADMNAESQVYAQSLELIKYLTARPIVKDYLDDEFIVLMNDLYMRGFLEADEIGAAAAWAHQVIPRILLRRFNNRNQSAAGSDQPGVINITAVLHINHRMRENVPLWMSLHGHKFAEVQVYVPGLRGCKPISGIELNCISDDYKGYFAYESITDAIMKHRWEGIRPTRHGFLFVHDDVVWKPDIGLGSHVSRMSPLKNLDTEPRWPWQKMFKAQMARFKAIEYPDFNFDFHFGQSNFFYVASKDFNVYTRVASQARQQNVFLEIAVPTIFKIFIKDKSFKPLNLFTTWDYRRKSPVLLKKGLCMNGTDLVHPIKFSTVDGVLSHFPC